MLDNHLNKVIYWIKNKNKIKYIGTITYVDVLQ